MKKIRIIMDSGMQYTLDSDINELLNKIHNSAGVVINQMVTLGNDKKIIINPAHISSIELYED